MTKITTAYGWFSLRPRFLQRVNKRVGFLIAISIAAFFQGAIINGFVNVALTSIETRFGVGSKEVGFIPSSYDIGSLLCVIPLAYFGGRMSQTRILGSCLLISSAGAFIMFLPHLVTINEPSTMDVLKESAVTKSGFCGTSQEIESQSNLKGWVSLFYIGMIVMGLGFGPLWTNTFDYLDKNVTHESFPVYSAIFTLAGVVGPGCGFLVGGLFLSLPFDDVRKQSEAYKNMTDSQYEDLTENTNFIGAYWIGFVLSAIGLFFIAVPVGGFPYEFPESETIRRKKVNEAFGATTLNEDYKLQTAISWYDFKTGFIYIVKNPIVICVALAGSMESFLLASMSSFGPKLLEVTFNLTSSDAALTVGYILIPSATVALIVGGLIPKVCSFSIRQLLLFCFISSFVTFCSTFGLFVSCGQGEIIEPNDVITFQGRTCDVTSCSCNLNDFKPYCLDKKTILFSPCYYGCQNETLSSCSCYNSTTDSELTSGSCEISEFCSTSNFYILVMFVVIAIFTVFFNLPAAEAALDRSVEPKFRSLAFGLDVFLLRLFGTIPATLVVGAMFDSKCTLWQIHNDGEKGACLRYDESVAAGFTAICIVTSALMTIFFLAAYLFDKFKRKLQSGEKIDEKMGAIETQKSMDMSNNNNVSDSTNGVPQDNSKMGEKYGNDINDGNNRNLTPNQTRELKPHELQINTSL